MPSSESTASPFTNPCRNGGGPASPVNSFTVPVVTSTSASTGGGPPTVPSDAATTASFVVLSYATTGPLPIPNTGSVRVTRGPKVFAPTLEPNTNVEPLLVFSKASTAVVGEPWFRLIPRIMSSLANGGVHVPVNLFELSGLSSS